MPSPVQASTKAPSTQVNVLVGDIGGTNARLSLWKTGGKEGAVEVFGKVRGGPALRGPDVGPLHAVDMGTLLALIAQQ